MEEELVEMVRSTPGLAAAVTELLERIEEKGGRVPERITLAASSEVREGLRRIFTPRAVRGAGAGNVRVELGAALREIAPGAEDAIVARLYAAVGRAPRDRAAEERALRGEIERGLVSLEAAARSTASAGFLESQRRELAGAASALLDRARGKGARSALDLAADVVRCLDALDDLREPIRAQGFAARHLGSSKALRRSGELHRWVGEALVAHHPRTVERLEDLGVFPSLAAFRASALEAHGVLFDEAAASVLCFGPLVYRVDGEVFDHVARHARRGHSARLLAQQLRDARVDAPGARRVTVFENLAPYLDYVDACVAGARQGEIVICAGGQANLAVVALLRHLREHRLQVRYSGDLDRSGILILRSLSRRTGVRLTERFMDVDTHRRYAAQAIAVSTDERARLAALVRTDDPSAPGHALLREIHATGRWIEQEAFGDEVLEALLAE